MDIVPFGQVTRWDEQGADLVLAVGDDAGDRRMLVQFANAADQYRLVANEGASIRTRHFLIWLA